MNLQQQLAQFPRLDLVGTATPLEKLSRLSDYLGREIYLKRDDVTPMAMGGNKLRKLEFLAADALRQGADTLVTAGAIQSTTCARRRRWRRNWACTASRCWKTLSIPARKTT